MCVTLVDHRPDAWATPLLQFNFAVNLKLLLEMKFI